MRLIAFHPTLLSKFITKVLVLLLYMLESREDRDQVEHFIKTLCAPLFLVLQEKAYKDFYGYRIFADFGVPLFKALGNVDVVLDMRRKAGILFHTHLLETYESAENLAVQGSVQTHDYIKYVTYVTSLMDLIKRHHHARGGLFLAEDFHHHCSCLIEKIGSIDHTRLHLKEKDLLIILSIYTALAHEGGLLDDRLEELLFSKIREEHGEMFAMVTRAGTLQERARFLLDKCIHTNREQIYYLISVLGGIYDIKEWMTVTNPSVLDFIHGDNFSELVVSMISSGGVSGGKKYVEDIIEWFRSAISRGEVGIESRNEFYQRYM